MTYPAQHTSPSPGGSPWRLPQLRHRVAVPLVTVLLTATLGRLVVLSPQITHGETALLEGLSQHRNVLLDAVATAVQYALSNGAVVLIIAAVIGWLAVLRRRPLDATGFGITALAGWGAVGLVKVFVERPRPTFLSGEALAPVTGSMSFPSSHTGAVVAIVLALGLVASRRSSRRRIALLGTLAVVIVGAARMYSGAHYPLDVLAAVPVAWAGVMAGCALANTVVPALAFGFSWRQAGVSQPAPATVRRAGSRTATAPAPSYRPARGSTPPDGAAQHDERTDRAA
ncbi:phosphatase PAP2 family protein [Kocuria marina]|uniref:phosphatase PAP2 family protein n=1 Tax=Kocuria marina TaxID=223184 RepID=UPI0022DEC7EB|nr:phosphatase PAP2 family protein [Kocuria marina]